MSDIEGMNDRLDRPAHYCEGRVIEPWDVVEDWKLDFFLGCALKYLSRAGRKGDPIEDLEKAIRYIRRKIEQLSREDG